jgi:16S rRNA (uracil1498-N3)-methyltransferase
MTAGLHRFFVDPALLGAEHVALTGVQAHQMSRVLRLKVGDRVVLLDGAGNEYVVRLDEVRSAAVTATVETVQRSRPEPGLILTLYQALVPRDRFETVLQKGTEIGVSRFVPVWCERSIVPGGDKIDAGRLERWRRIVTEAAEQCERGIAPEVAPPLRFGEALAAAAREGPALVAWERETSRSVGAGLDAVLRERGDDRMPLALFVGPEGGLSEAEIGLAQGQDRVRTVSLGPRILRTETAGPILAALALYAAGDLEPAE